MEDEAAVKTSTKVLTDEGTKPVAAEADDEGEDED